MAANAPERVFVALGSNLGDRDHLLADARRLIAALPQTAVLGETAVEDTDPLGPVAQGPFRNQMVLLRTGLGPRALLEALLGIERTLGRERRERWGPRLIDLDIVRYGDRVVNEPGLTLPHPELPRREFWQRELKELEAHAV